MRARLDVLVTRMRRNIMRLGSSRLRRHCTNGKAARNEQKNGQDYPNEYYHGILLHGLS